MNRLIILNRTAPASADGWIHIVPKGELPNTEAGIVQVLDDASLDSILANIQKDKNRLGDKWPGIYAGREHWIYDPGQDSAALAWFKDFQKRPDGLWANADGLTPDGRAALKNRAYKFTSFVADPSDLEKVGGSQGGLPRYRVMKIETVGFTNQANGKDILTPISNRKNFGSHGTETAWNAAAAENKAHVQANKEAADEADAQRKAESEGEEAELALPALEKFCRAVKKVMEATKRTGFVMMTLPDAWTYAQRQFPDLWAAAFGGGDNDDAAAAGQQASQIANRVAALAGRNFDFGWRFVQAELPQIFNRMTPPHGRVTNRVSVLAARFSTPNAAKVFNRLVRAESAVNSLPESAAFVAVKNRHPGLYGLAFDTMLPSDAVRTESNLSALLA